MTDYPKVSELTPSQQTALHASLDEWVGIALSTGRLTEDEKRRAIEAAYGLYAAAELPLPKYVGIVRSPLEMAVEGGKRAWEIYKETNPKVAKGTSDEQGARECAKRWYGPAQGGNAWAGWCARLCFWRDTMGLGERPELKKNYAAFAHWETLARLTHWRWVAPEFCLISEKPIRLVTELRGTRYVAHSLDGPTHEYADGWKIWHIDGIRVTEKIVMEPETITLDEIKDEQNAELRRVLRQQYGEGRYLRDTGAKLVDMDYEGAKQGAAPRALLQEAGSDDRWLVGTDGSTKRVYYMPVPSTVRTCRQAHELIAGMDESRIVSKS